MYLSWNWINLYFVTLLCYLTWLVWGEWAGTKFQNSYTNITVSVTLSYCSDSFKPSADICINSFQPVLWILVVEFYYECMCVVVIIGLHSRCVSSFYYVLFFICFVWALLLLFMLLIMQCCECVLLFCAFCSYCKAVYWIVLIVFDCAFVVFRYFYRGFV